jgi:putative PEP-CTERM system TPR-repeat lipoprotein
MMAMAELAAINKQEQEYVRWLEKAAKANPTAVPPRAALVRHHMARKAPQKALAIANELVDANPDDPAALNLLGAVQLATNDNASTISTFSKLTNKAEQSPDAFLRLALAQIAGKKLTDARSTLNKALSLKPDHLQSEVTLIGLELAENKPDAALKVARQIQVQYPRSPLGHDREGEIQLAQKRPAEAAKAFEQAVAKGAGSAGLIKLHRAYILTGNVKVAEQRLADWIKLHPNDNIVRAYAAEQYMVGGRNKEAIAEYQAILRQAPKDILSLNNLANLYLLEKDPRALTTAEQSYRLDPNNPAVLDTLGWILVEQGRAPQGLDLLRKALAQTPKNASIRYHHAVALARTGDTARARRELEQLLAEKPTFDEEGAARALLKSL